MLHDAALLYAHALNKTLNMNGSIHDGHLIVQNMLNYTFEGNLFDRLFPQPTANKQFNGQNKKQLSLSFSGASGKVSIDHVGDRQSALVVKNVQNGRYKRTANFFTGSNLLKVLNDTVVIWPGKTTDVPVGRPECGFLREFCPPDPATGNSTFFV